ncbi:aminoglycoside phosphotransferase family protein [Nesterenkonia sp. LB17]|uniref:phosphotransferase family protein n=1 Tax=unclassified Nesterenkonia TaxID=2629769 RepID=UPI001F4D0CD9|nr:MULTISPECIES: phosphotransferase [unclassified Nesterenkonia]MCH8559804.1 aminoglycoside phosphotransferase family protein [Nesterenkonia sp. DZ6]MCH8561968.1 aminoglycoside phosphotransferase family protein [Nesterenkonia sp. YGD6]MCH8564495.1 aminoglycoside phosphotransferase family protein [Nesterenkonia sp. LB17]MCH8570121.1 aminoglycoside phosphotransferase family protein [Nesterenkonia sp. AY15]
MSQPHTEWTAADEAAAQASRIPGARTLLDPHALSELLDQPATITRVRIKTGHSVVAAFTTDDAEPGWAMLTVHEDKLNKARQRAADADGLARFCVHSEHPPHLFSGSLWADPVLGKDLTEARQALNGATAAEAPWKILRYNPRRRVVAAVPPTGPGHGEKILRVAARGTAPALSTAQRWRELGLPLVRSTPVGGRGTATSAPLWGWADLSSSAYAPAATTAGAALGRLHRHTAGSRRDRLPIQPSGSASAVAAIAPWLADAAWGLADRVRAAVDALPPGPDSELHGDLSPDQVVMATPESHKIRLIDFDRSGVGDPMRDVGSWAASCRRLRLEPLISSFLEGYCADEAPDLRRIAVWEAYAQLSSVTDPFRHREPEWADRMQTTLSLGEEALKR